MSTRCRIAVRNSDDTFTSIYCHWGGFPREVGLTLRDHYTATAKVRALLALGDLSELGAELGQRHGFEDHSHPDWTTAYGRDRGDPDTAALQSADLEALIAAAQECGAEWLYIWTGHGWQAAEGGIAYFGLPADKPPGGLESIEYWLQRRPE